MSNHDILDLYDLLMEQIRDLADGEAQQLEIFPDLDDLATSLELRELIERHEQETLRQSNRLQKVLEMLEEEGGGEHCEGIEGLIKEALKLARRCKVHQVCDAGLITSIQHVNHYEIAGYGTAISYAKTLGRHDVAELLLKSLREEKQADEELSRLAEEQINVDARWTSLTGSGEIE